MLYGRYDFRCRFTSDAHLPPELSPELRTREPATYDLLWDFAQRYYDASHPAGLVRMGTAAAA